MADLTARQLLEDLAVRVSHGQIYDNDAGDRLVAAVRKVLDLADYLNERNDRTWDTSVADCIVADVTAELKGRQVK